MIDRDNIKCSVAMATYNGEKYIKEQIDSIILNLSKNDELVISDDGSTDRTLEIINEYMNQDKRIKLFEGPHLGVKQNFANSIQKCEGQYIFLTDQDDIWMNNKIEEVLNVFEKEGCSLVIHNAQVIDSKLNIIENSFFKYRNSGKGIFKNIWKNTYIGCCMAFTSNLKQNILPIPNNIEMHDQWIGIINEKYGKCFFYDNCLIKYRRHDNNVSNMHHYPINKMLKNRINFIKELRKRCE